ncbi:unnamed protein product, partial [Ascophyllum nodosum]
MSQISWGSFASCEATPFAIACAKRTRSWKRYRVQQYYGDGDRHRLASQEVTLPHEIWDIVGGGDGLAQQQAAFEAIQAHRSWKRPSSPPTKSKSSWGSVTSCEATPSRR